MEAVLMDEQLIESVKKFPCLWNTNLRTYKCNDTKDTIWEQVVKRTNYRNVKIAKARWKQLRDNHRDALKRQKCSRSGQVTVQKKRWKFQKQMEFLLPYITNRGRASHDASNEESISRQSNSDDDSSQSTHLSNDPSLSRISNKQSGIDPLFVPFLADSSEPTPVSSTSIQKNRKGSISELQAEHQVNQKPYRIEHNNVQELKNCDEIDHFFLTMAKTLKKLPDYLQLQVKKKCFAALTEAEELNLESSWAPNMHLKYSPRSE